MTLDSEGKNMLFNQLDKALVKLAEQQAAGNLKLARRIVPGVTSDDILQPNDFPQLEQHPEFRYEEGTLAGILSALALVRAFQKDSF